MREIFYSEKKTTTKKLNASDSRTFTCQNKSICKVSLQSGKFSWSVPVKVILWFKFFNFGMPYIFLNYA